VRIDVALADELELAQSLDQRRANGRALAQQDQDLGIREPVRQDVLVGGLIVPDRDVVSRELAKAGEVPHYVGVVVEDRDLHRRRLSMRDGADCFFMCVSQGPVPASCSPARDRIAALSEKGSDPAQDIIDPDWRKSVDADGRSLPRSRKDQSQPLRPLGAS
jgi:hypothetical protein